MIYRLLRHATILAVVAIAATSTAAGARPAGLEQIVRERAEAHGASGDLLVGIIDCETGRTWDASLVGAAGELGPVQLHPRGELIEFYRRGYSDPTDWWEAGDFASSRLAEGERNAWRACL